jgi:membrane-associated protease RseP (regulator of RpoE activity)
VTSENGRTIRKTTIYRNGQETTKTEFLDADGKVIGGEDRADQGDAGGSGADEVSDGPWIGLRVQEAPAALRDQLGMAEDEGVVVDAVAADGPAAKAGLRVNDVLFKLDETPLGKPEDLRAALDGREAGEQVAVGYLRRGARAKVDVTLEEKPANDRGDAGSPPPAARGMDRDGQRGERGKAGRIEVEVSGNAGEGLDAVLKNPDVPEAFKQSVREMQEKMREFENKHGQP